MFSSLWPRGGISMSPAAMSGVRGRNGWVCVSWWRSAHQVSRLAGSWPSSGSVPPPAKWTVSPPEKRVPVAGSVIEATGAWFSAGRTESLDVQATSARAAAASAQRQGGAARRQACMVDRPPQSAGGRGCSWWWRSRHPLSPGEAGAYAPAVMDARCGARPTNRPGRRARRARRRGPPGRP